MRRRLRAALALAVLLQLTACATRPPADEASPWTSGKLSLRVDALADKPARSVNASFDLRGSGQRGELRLMSSLGTIVASARWSADRAVLQTGDGEREYADLETLSQDALGEALTHAVVAGGAHHFTHRTVEHHAACQLVPIAIRSAPNDALEHRIRRIIAALKIEFLPLARDVRQRTIDDDGAAFAAEIEAGVSGGAHRLDQRHQAGTERLARLHIRCLFGKGECAVSKRHFDTRSPPENPCPGKG